EAPDVLLIGAEETGRRDLLRLTRGERRQVHVDRAGVRPVDAGAVATDAAGVGGVHTAGEAVVRQADRVLGRARQARRGTAIAGASRRTGRAAADGHAAGTAARAGLAAIARDVDVRDQRHGGFRRAVGAVHGAARGRRPGVHHTGRERRRLGVRDLERG